MRTFRYSEGTRVEVRRGGYPMARDLVGREGLIVDVDEYRPDRYGVQLDGEEGVRGFDEDELAPVASDPKPPSDQGSAGPGIR